MVFGITNHYNFLIKPKNNFFLQYRKKNYNVTALIVTMLTNEEENASLNNSIQKEEEFTSKEEAVDLTHCHWCNKSKSEVDNLFIFELRRKNQEAFQLHSCSTEHEAKTKKYYNYIGKAYSFYLILALLAPLLLILISVILANWFYVFLVFISIGIGLLITPLMGDRIVRSIGLRNNIILGRIFGIILLAIGVFLILFGGTEMFTQ